MTDDEPRIGTVISSLPREPAADATEVLTEAQCRGLLGTQTVGRVGITSGGLPCILPVCYAYDDGAVVFRTGAGTKLRSAVSGDVLAFEVDCFDAASGKGWSVLALGRASVITTEHEHEGLPTFDGNLEHGLRNHYVRLQCELLSGRVLETAPRS
jgi:nitroimidazol reductase NimA-like FMN-containing flavoprotein (pyridoxamine 5'-phosphate oxidase superfamily)